MRLGPLSMHDYVHVNVHAHMNEIFYPRCIHEDHFRF